MQYSSRMRISPSSGYTLLELLIVLVILGVLISVASLSITSTETNPAEEAMTRLKLDVDAVMNEAIVRSEPFALAFSERGYGFYHQDEKTEKWTLVKDDSLLSKRDFDKGLKTQMMVDDADVALPASLEEELADDVEASSGVVFVEPTGEITPFSYQITPDKKTPQYAKFNSMGQVEGDLDKADAEGKDDNG